MVPISQSIDAPLHIGSVRLAVRDLERVCAFYREVVGLREIGREGDRLLLGSGERPFLELLARPNASVAPSGAVGLFHTAFLLPSRADLGRWLRHAAQIGIMLDGASDHGVSEAVYLRAPEGNGIEIYADQPVSAWPVAEGRLRMTTRRLAVPEVMQAGGGTGWTSAPSEMRVGHIHLQVASVDESEAFYRDVIGFDTMVRMPAARFLATGGYHHHVAVNAWHTAGPDPRDPDWAGLTGFTLRSADPVTRDGIRSRAERAGYPVRSTGGSVVLTDPSGVEIAVA